jgi:hypothetical protein
METKHIERSDIVNSEKEDENEQIPNGGVKVILKDDGKIVNKSEYIDIPTTSSYIHPLYSHIPFFLHFHVRFPF